MDTVTVRASVHLSGFPLGETVTVVETPMVAGAIRKGALVLVERHVAEADTRSGWAAPSEDIYEIAGAELEPHDLLGDETETVSDADQLMQDAGFTPSPVRSRSRG
jgi:hypothetical protein